MGTLARKSLGVVLGLLVLQTLPSQALEGDGTYAAWKITKTEWTEAEEQNYSKYVALIGDGVSRGLCSTVSKCFKNPAVNPYASSDPAGLKFYSDCADFPYMMRAYYAWRNQLPFGYVLSVRPIQGGPETAKDLRYSPFGNVVKDRRSIIVPDPMGGPIRYPNALKIFNGSLANEISSAHFRVSYSGMDADGLFSDFYPVKINRQAVRPGTTIYDPNGHVVTIYKITQDGRIYYIDAHPDNSLTSGIFNSGFMRSYPGQGAGFKNWRPISLVGAQYDPSIGYYGGTVVGAKDRDLPFYGTEQYYGTSRTPEWKQSQFSFEGRTMSYYEFIRNRLADGPLVENPVDDVRVMADELCAKVQDRTTAVQVAIAGGMADKPHPEVLPKNIFGAEGDWETYASPARDARLKMAFKELRDYVEEALGHQRAHDGKVAYSGGNLAADMLTAYKQRSMACKITYKNTNGVPVTFSLDQARERMYDISFDPYHCVELRWGAKGRELATCRNDQSKFAWYQAEQWMRFQHERNTEAFTGFSLSELDGPKPGAGVASGPDLDVIAFLTRNQ
jgi:hypothetical protein